MTAPPIDQKVWVIADHDNPRQLWKLLNETVDHSQTHVIYEVDEANPIAAMMPFKEYMDLMSVRWTSLSPLVARIEELEKKVTRMYNAGVIMAEKPAEGQEKAPKTVQRLLHSTFDEAHTWNDRHSYDWAWVKWADQTHDWGRRVHKALPYERVFGTIHWNDFAPFTMVESDS